VDARSGQSRLLTKKIPEFIEGAGTVEHALESGIIREEKYNGERSKPMSIHWAVGRRPGN